MRVGCRICLLSFRPFRLGLIWIVAFWCSVARSPPVRNGQPRRIVYKFSISAATSRADFHSSIALDVVAQTAKQLQVLDVIRAALAARNDMVNFKMARLEVLVATRAVAGLFAVQRLRVCAGDEVACPSRCDVVCRCVQPSATLPSFRVRL